MRRWRFLVGVCSLAAMALPLWAAPRLWVEASLEPASSPIYAQVTYVLRFGHAVDVRAPRLAAPSARLAEVLPLGEVRESETTRDGLRYRVLERRFAVLPFASGDLDLQGEVAGSTPAQLSEIGGQREFVLAAPPRRLAVLPASDTVLPALAVTLTASGAPPPEPRVGDVWTRRIEVEAVGVDGAAITLPAVVALAEAAGWVAQADPPQVGRRTEAGRVVGFLRQDFHFQPRQSGRLVMPEIALDYRPPAASSLQRERLPAVTVTVAPGDHAAAPSVESRALSGEWALALLAGLGLLAAVAWRGRRRWPAAWARRRKRRAVLAACRAGDPMGTRAALLAYAATCGGPARSLADLASHGSSANWRAALAELDDACFAPGGVKAWSGAAIRQGLRRWRTAAPSIRSRDAGTR